MDNALIIAQYVFALTCLCGLAMNIFVLVSLTRIRLGSKVTTILLKVQVIIDLFVCLAVIVAKLIAPIPMTNIYYIDLIWCHVWYKENLFGLGALLSTHNLVCICLDRALATFIPLTYRNSRSKILLASFLYQIFIFAILYPPILFHRRFENGRCYYKLTFDHPAQFILIRIHSCLWLTFMCIEPAICTVGSHLHVIRKLTQLRKRRTQNSGITCLSDAFKSQLRGLALTTISLCVFCTILQLPTSITYVMNDPHTLFYNPDKASHHIRKIFLTISHCVNPLVLILMIKALRNRVVDIFTSRSRAITTFLSTARPSDILGATPIPGELLARRHHTVS